MCDLTNLGVQEPTVLSQDLKHHCTASTTVAFAVTAAITRTNNNKSAEQLIYSELASL